MPYRFNADPTKQSFEPKPAGDYTFVVVDVGDGPTLNDNKNWVLSIQLVIGDDRSKVYDSPWARSEQSATQDGRDGIAEFLISIGMAPAAGKDPNWKGCIGKKGRCKIKIEDDQKGIPRNRVAFYYAPKQAEGMSGQSVSVGEFEKARKAQTAKMQGGAQPEEDSLPY